MKFRIDVYAATGSTPIGDGPIIDVLGINVSERLNQVGEIQITIPASVAAQRSLARGMRYRVYHATLGYLGEFKHLESTIDASAETITIRAYDSLINLSERVAGFRRNYSNQDFDAVAADLFATSLSWTVSYEGGAPITNPVKVSYSVEGENYLRMADYLRKYIRGWFRRQGDTEIRFGKFTSTTPVVTFVAASIIANDQPVDQAQITQITRTRAGGEVVNRVYPVGAGIGETKLTLSSSNRSTTAGFPYAIQSTSVVSGAALGYYIEDSSSIASYGRVERVVAWNEIRPISNSAADLQNAGNALYDIASAYLSKYKSENDAYTLSAVDVPSTLRVGDLVRVQYNGVAEMESGTVGWLNIANNFFVTEITRSFDSGGEAQATISIAANGEAVIGDTEVLYDILADVQTLKLRTQPTQTYFTKCSDTVNIGGTFWGSIPMSTKAFFLHRFGAEVLAINEVYLEISMRQWIFITGMSMTATATNAAKGYVFTSNSATTASTTQANFTYKPNVDSGGAHDHVLTVYGGGSGNNIYVNTGTKQILSTAVGDTNVPVSNGGAHDHGMDHKHALIDTASHSHSIALGTPEPDAQTSSTIPVIGLKYQCGGSSGWVEITSSNASLFANTNDVTPLFNATALFNNGTSLESHAGVQYWGIIRVNVTSLINSLDWRSNDVRFDIQWSAGRAAVMTQLYGRVTIQPIAV